MPSAGDTWQQKARQLDAAINFSRAAGTGASSALQEMKRESEKWKVEYMRTLFTGLASRIASIRSRDGVCVRLSHFAIYVCFDLPVLCFVRWWRWSCTLRCVSHTHTHTHTHTQSHDDFIVLHGLARCLETIAL